MEKQEIYGVRAIIECIEAKQSIEKVWLLKGQASPIFKELERLLRENSVAHSYVPKERLDRFNAKNHQGAIAAISPIDFVPLESMIEKAMEKDTPPIFLLLDQITDTRNLGAIIRSASATAVDGIILPQTGSARINSDTIKTSAGAIFSIPLAKVNHLKDAIYQLQGCGIKTVGMSEKAENTVYQENISGPLALVMGSEEKGITKSTLAILDKTVKLPMLGTISSLNVSVACGAVLYEVVRQRNFT
ncbi:MAG: 23S rRNA (guanosine(2251)-2'-O)-methyltransferase RlmB [Flavobacteriaceae bacterium]|nr:23S rRNA (guanosine(2251)-2'-O)-methyltransferase RlmB [Flavobacteriaceae bacterium]